MSEAFLRHEIDLLTGRPVYYKAATELCREASQFE